MTHAVCSLPDERRHACVSASNLEAIGVSLGRLCGARPLDVYRRPGAATTSDANAYRSSAVLSLSPLGVGHDDGSKTSLRVALDPDRSDRNGDPLGLGANGLLDLALDKRRLEKLADRRRRQRRRDLDALRNRRLFGDRPRRVREQLRLGDDGAGLELNIGDGQFAGVRVRTSDRRGQGDGRMRLQRVLDQLRIDVVAAANDQLLLAPGEPEVAVGVLSAEVSGVEPGLARRARSRSPCCARDRDSRRRRWAREWR